MLRCIRVECNQPEVDMTILAWVIINANRDYANFLHYLDISSPGILVVCASGRRTLQYHNIKSYMRGPCGSESSSQNENVKN